MAKEAAIKTYKKFCTIPNIKYAYIERNTDFIHTEWSRTELTALEQIQFRTIHRASDFASTASFKLTNEKWNVLSFSQKLSAVLSQQKDKESKILQFIEVWSSSNLVHKIAVENLTEHGKIYEDDNTFGVFAFSPSEKCLMYIAERKLPKGKSYFSEAKPESSETTAEGTEFEYRDDWGELLTDKYQPMACILDLDSKKVTVLDWLPENLSYGKAVWAGDDNTVYVVGWCNDPYKLGLIYCTMRKNTLFRVNVKNKTYQIIKDDGCCVSTPVLSRQGNKLAYLDNPQGGAHRHSNRLLVVDVTTSNHKELKLPLESCCCIVGLHCESLIASAWCADERRIVLSSICKTKKDILVVDTHTEQAIKISKENEAAIWDILYVGEDGRMLASCSSINQSQHLVIGTLGKPGEEGNVVWKRVTQPSDLCTPSTLSVSLRSITPPEKDFNYDYMLLEPKPQGAKKHPLLVFNHGGPHSLYTESFSWKLACYCSLGYAILLTNYRGSAGYGEGNINNLLGKVGVQDVQDTLAALNEVVGSGRVDADRMAVLGGSHGGFLTAHFIGQYPDLFKVAIALNPVINFTNMLGVSDIPDWIFTELGFPFDWSLLPSEEMRAMQYSRSPFAHVKKMKTPLMLAVGAQDRRVPCSQPFQLYKALKALNQKVKMYVYPKSSHPLSETEADSDLFVNMVLWIDQHINA